MSLLLLLVNQSQTPSDCDALHLVDAQRSRLIRAQTQCIRFGGIAINLFARNRRSDRNS